MSIEKTPAIVLSVLPYRESSCIVSLLTRIHGRIQGIARGIKKQGAKKSIPVERGILLDTIIYLRAQRDLQNLGEIQISDFFPSIRSDIEKTALRDVALELIIKSITDTESHPELFDSVSAFLFNLDKEKDRLTGCFLLLNFCFELAAHLGFQLHTDFCTECGRVDLTDEGGFLVIENGSINCKTCHRDQSQELFIQSSHIRAIRGAYISDQLQSSSKEVLRIIKLALYYCRYHLGFKGELKSVQFLDELFASSC
jgi:DNA repair protein RecO